MIHNCQRFGPGPISLKIGQSDYNNNNNNNNNSNNNNNNNFKIYNVIDCVNKNLITHFVLYLENEKRLDIETFSIDRVLNKKYFYGKIMRKI